MTAPMLLAFDVGNTNWTVGLYQGAARLKIWRLQTVHGRTSDEYGLLMHQLLLTAGVAPKQIDGVIVASVVPVLTRTVEEMAKDVFGHTALVVGPGIKTGM